MGIKIGAFLLGHGLFIATLLGCALLGAATSCLAAPLRDQPVTVTQPDGETLQLLASGDEFYNWLHDQNGYVIMQNADGVYVYAQRQAGDLAPSAWRVNSVSPEAVGLAPNLKPDPAILKARIDALRRNPGQP